MVITQFYLLHLLRRQLETLLLQVAEGEPLVVQQRQTGLVNLAALAVVVVMTAQVVLEQVDKEIAVVLI
jgi:hypothetical protein